MRVIETLNFTKLAKSKYPKSETTPYNPWAVCHKSVGPDKDDPKFERCVHHLKDQNKEKNKGSGGKSKSCRIDETKPVGEGEIYTPNKEDSWIEESKGHKFTRIGPRQGRENGDEKWNNVLRKMRELRNDPVLASLKKKK